MTTTTVITKKNSVEGALITDLAIVESSETMVLESGGDSDAADGAAKSVSTGYEKKKLTVCSLT